MKIKKVNYPDVSGFHLKDKKGVTRFSIMFTPYGLILDLDYKIWKW